MAAFLSVTTLTTGSLGASAEGEVRYSCSNQVYEAFGKEMINAFSVATGIGVKVYQASSEASLNRLMHGYADIAAIARKLKTVTCRLRIPPGGFLRRPLRDHCKAGMRCH